MAGRPGSAAPLRWGVLIQQEPRMSNWNVTSPDVNSPVPVAAPTQTAAVGPLNSLSNLFQTMLQSNDDDQDDDDSD